MNYEYDQKQKAVIKGLEIVIDHNYITKNELVNLDAVAHIITGEVEKGEEEQKKNEELSMMFDIMNRYFPDKLQLFLASEEKGKE